MIEIRPEVRRSWFDPIGSRTLAAKTGERLTARAKGHRGVFLTLSYAREGWDNAQHAYRAASDDRHVRRFIERLGQWLWWRMPEHQRPLTATGKPANPLNGLWCCKLEFQKDGFLHWHLIILDIDYLPHDVLTGLWDEGFVYVTRLTKRRLIYQTKYVAKADSIPPWLYLEPTRSVKFFRASPGFWQDTKPQERQKTELQRLYHCSESIGQACHRAQSRTQTINRNQHRRTIKRPAHQVISALLDRGWTTSPEAHTGWIRLLPPRRGMPAAGGHPRRLHLTDTPNPPSDPTPHIPWWWINSIRSLSDDPSDHA